MRPQEFPGRFMKSHCDSECFQEGSNFMAFQRISLDFRGSQEVLTDLLWIVMSIYGLFSALAF